MKIVALNQEYLAKAIQLVNSEFLDEEENVFPASELEASLNPKLPNTDPFVKDHDMRSMQYYVAVSEQQVLGIIGLYELHSDFEKNDWVGWFCVDERFRGQRIGVQLLDFVTQKARQRGKENLLLYTSTHEDERTAQKLYECNDFHIIKTEPKKHYSLLYRQKKLNPVCTTP